MGRVTRDQVTDYQDTWTKFENNVIDAVRAMFIDTDLTDEGLWGYVVDSMSSFLGTYGNLSAIMGANWYQRCRDIETDGRGRYIATPTVKDPFYGGIVNETKSILQAVSEGNKTQEEAVTELATTVGDYIAKVNRDTLLTNLENENAQPARSERREPIRVETAATQVVEEPEPTKSEEAPAEQPVSKIELPERYEEMSKQERTSEGSTRTSARMSASNKSTNKKHGKVRYMRVPRLDCKCAFCITMASRGPVYRTEETAGGGDPVNKYHRDCRCSVVPVSSSDPMIDGYEEEINAYYDMYRPAYEYLGELNDKDPTDYTDYDKKVMERIEKAYEQHLKRQQEDPDVPDWQPLNAVQIIMRIEHSDLH